MTAGSIHELRTLVVSHHPLVVVETFEEERARRLVAAAVARLPHGFFEWSLSRGLHYASDGRGGNGIATTGDPAGVLRHLLGMDRQAVYLLKDFAPHLEAPEVARLMREVCQHFAETGSCAVITGSAIELPADVDHHAAYLPLALPGREELANAVRSTLESLRARSDVELDLTLDEERNLVEALRGLTLHQARQAVAYAALDDEVLDQHDLPRILERKARSVRESGLLEYFPAEENDFELGGFGALLAWLDRARQGFGPEAAKLGLDPPKGLLLTGVQGCGKSLAARVIARHFGQPLLRLDAGTLYDKYIGESEKNLRRAIALAESMAPAVLWIDEIEKAFGTGGEGGLDGGLAKRMHGALLTWLQEKRASVFVVATANDVFSLPPELMRKGRFDEIFFVDLPRPDERRAIFQIHLRKRKQDPARFRLDDLVFASEGMSGAEIEQAVVAGLYRALHEKRPLDDPLLLRELDATVPLSHSRREDIDRLRALARDRFVSVSGA